MNSLEIENEREESSNDGIEDEDSLRGLTIIEPEELGETVVDTSSHSAALSRLIFDCRQCSDEGLAGLLRDGLNLLGRTEVDIVKMFAVRLERAERWTFGSELPPPQMRAGLLQWLTRLAELELG